MNNELSKQITFNLTTLKMKIQFYSFLFFIIGFWNLGTANSNPLFEVSTPTNAKISADLSKLDGTFLKLNATSLHELYKSDADNIQITIPRQSNSNIEITIHKKQILGNNFYVTEQSDIKGRNTVEYIPGHFYQNISNGQFVAISIFENEINGIINVDGQNYTLGPIKDETKTIPDEYIFYKEADSDIPQLDCGTDPTKILEMKIEGVNSVEKTMMDRLVHTYFEADHNLLLGLGSTSNVANYITNMFNIVNAIYAIEQVDLQISEISIWTTPDPYPATLTKFDILNKFVDNANCVNGNIAHYVSSTTFGGVAGVGTVCDIASYAVSGIGTNTNVNTFPIYTYSADLVAHETGHALSSPHTHSCFWPGGVIDNCAAPEGNCGPTANPFPNTIMSYCGSNVDFTLGLGPLPGQKVRDYIDAQTCLDDLTFINIFENDILDCLGNNINLDATIPNCSNCIYNWDDGTTGASRNVTVTNSAINYCLEVFDPNTGLTYADHVRVSSVNDGISLDASFPFTGDPCGPVNVTLSVIDGTGSYTYTWPDGSSNNPKLGVERGVYNITITDGTCESVRSISLFNQPNYLIDRSYGGDGSDQANSIVATSDGNILLAGGASGNGGDLGFTNGNEDYWIIKTTQSGDIIWKTNFGGALPDVCNDAIETPDGGFLLAGYTRSEANSGDVENNNGGFYEADGWLIKIDANGNKLWTKNYGSAGDDIFETIIETNDGNYVLTGSTTQTNGGDRDVWLLKINPTGDVIWEKEAGGSDTEFVEEVVEASNGDLYVSGGTYSQEIENYTDFIDAIIIRFDADGNEIWKKAYGGTNIENYTRLTATSDGNIVFGSTSSSEDLPFDNEPDLGQFNMWLVKINPNGDIIWNKAYAGSNTTTLNQITEVENGNLLVAGRFKYGADASFHFFSTNANGDIRWERNFGANGFDEVRDIVKLPDGKIFFTGVRTTGSVGSIDYVLYGYEDPCSNSECTDNDNDGFCLGEDCNDNDPNLPAIVGSTCNDNNSNTTNDVIQSDGCTCQGTIIGGGCNVSITSSNGGVTITGLTSAENAKLFNTSIATIWGCNPWSGTPCSNNESVNGLVVGDTYFLSVQSDNCDEWIPIVIQGGTTATCSDGIQNQGETGIDCGGPCAPCPTTPTCTDGIQNQGETGIDCGGPCAPCPVAGCNVSVSSTNGAITISGLTNAENAKLFDTNIDAVWGCNPWNGIPCSNSETITGLTAGATYFLSVQSDECDEWIPVTVQGGGPTPTCTDGIQNQGETGIDCGGPCAPCPITPTCTDGIQNQGETGIDCGGPCTPCPTGGCNVSVISSNGLVTVTGLTNAENAKLFDANVDAVWGCNPWSGTPCSNSETISGLTSGATYFLSVQSDECDEWIPVIVQGDGCPDADDDGICDDEDCEPNNPGIPTPPGTPCNDMNVNTTNDIIQADGCTCQGTPMNPNLSDLNIINFNSIEGMPGAVVYFPFTLRNIGVGTAVGDYQINTYISTDSNLSSDDIQEGSITTGNTVVGSQEVTGAITIPATLTPGLYTFFIVVDDNNDINEIDENNNTTIALLNVNGGGCNTPTPSGFTALGEFENSQYFMSNDAVNFATAQSQATAAGGHLTSIYNQAENDFIQSNLNGNIVLIGLNDLNNEGTLQWVNGETVTFNNLTTTNNSADDVGVMNFWAGTWDLNESFVERPFILEIPCVAPMPRIASKEVSLLAINKIFPNPTSDDLFVQIDVENDLIFKLVVSNIMGQTKEQKSINAEIGSNTIQLDLTNYPNGIYYLNFILDNEIISKKIIKVN